MQHWVNVRLCVSVRAKNFTWGIMTNALTSILRLRGKKDNPDSNLVILCEGRCYVKLKSTLACRSEINRNLRINSYAGMHLGCVLLMNNQLAERKGSHLLSVRPNEFIQVLCKCSLG